MKPNTTPSRVNSRSSKATSNRQNRPRTHRQTDGPADGRERKPDPSPEIIRSANAKAPQLPSSRRSVGRAPSTPAALAARTAGAGGTAGARAGAPAGAGAFEPLPYSEPVPEEQEQTSGRAAKPSYEAAYGHLRNGQVYPDPFPYEPPSKAESLALKLKPAQRTALELIVLGSQLSVAARSAGVTRMTLYRWMRHDPNFQAAYNTWQADAVVNSRTRFLGMANTATSTLECAVQTNPWIALAVVKSIGVLSRTTAGPTEPEECDRQIKLNDQHQALQRRKNKRPKCGAPPRNT